MPAALNLTLRSDAHKAKILDRILSNACSNPSDEPGYNDYDVELCCLTFRVTAREYRKINDSEGNYLYSKFEVRSMHIPPEV